MALLVLVDATTPTPFGQNQNIRVPSAFHLWLNNSFFTLPLRVESKHHRGESKNKSPITLTDERPTGFPPSSFPSTPALYSSQFVP